ncbi:MAG TPA: hypothetical protein VGN26_21245 [Armatimonadota bacterium]|jgi:hypothetical protein
MRRSVLAGVLAASMGAAYWLGFVRGAEAQASKKLVPLMLNSQGSARILTGQTELQSVRAPTGKTTGAVAFGLTKPFLAPPQVQLTAVEAGSGQVVVPMVESVTQAGFTYSVYAPFVRGPEIRFRVNWTALGEIPALPKSAAPATGEASQ